jgi:hypothetical protein
MRPPLGSSRPRGRLRRPVRAARPSVAGDQDAAPLAHRFRAPMPNARPMRYRLMSAASRVDVKAGAVPPTAPAGPAAAPALRLRRRTRPAPPSANAARARLPGSGTVPTRGSRPARSRHCAAGRRCGCRCSTAPTRSRRRPRRWTAAGAPARWRRSRCPLIALAPTLPVPFDRSSPVALNDTPGWPMAANGELAAPPHEAARPSIQRRAPHRSSAWRMVSPTEAEVRPRYLNVISWSVFSPMISRTSVRLTMV